MRLKVTAFGEDAEGIQLRGNPKHPEPIHTRIAFPGGDVDVVRTTDNEYWVHVRVNREDATSYDPCQPTARLVDGRVDLVSGYPTPAQCEAIQDPDIYHMAIRVGQIKEAKS